MEDDVSRERSTHGRDTKCWCSNLKVTDLLENLDIDGRILEWTLKEIG